MKLISKILLLSNMFIAAPVFAQDDPPTFTSGEFSIGGVLDKIVALIFPVAGLVCVVFIVIGGYMWIVSAGDPAKVKQAQGTLTWAIIGLVFVLVAAAIIRVVYSFVS